MEFVVEGGQDGGVEGLKLMKTPKLQLTAEQPSIKKDWNLPKMILYIQRQRRNHNETVGGSALTI